MKTLKKLVKRIGKVLIERTETGYRVLVRYEGKDYVSTSFSLVYAIRDIIEKMEGGEK